MLSRSGETWRPRISRSSPTFPITVTLARVDDVDEAAEEARAADAAAEDDDLHRARAGERPRADAALEPSEVGDRVDVVGEVRDRRRNDVGAERCARAGESARRSRGRRAGRRATARRGRARSSCRRARRRARARARASPPRASVRSRGDDAGDVCVDDEHRPDDVAKRGRDGGALAAAGVVDDARVVLGGDAGGLRRRASRRRSRRRARQAARTSSSIARASAWRSSSGSGAEPLLATRPAEGNDDRGHRSWRLSAWRTQRSPRSSRRSPRCSS